VIPLDRGGENIPENLAIAHHVCNQAKSNLLLSELDLPFESPSASRKVVDAAKANYYRTLAVA
jgi:5-methylcytosine-specific restriction endonuclease McrA